MVGAAAAIVARAPRCRPLPPQEWWETGGLYRAPPRAFAGDLRGVAERLEHVAGLQARGLVLGPLHPQIGGGGGPPNRGGGGPPKLPPLEELDPLLGTLQDFGDLLQAARKKGLQVLLDLTPDPWGADPWLGGAADPEFLQGVKRALGVWLERGVAGFFLDGIEELQPWVVAEWRNLTEQRPTPDGVSRVLVGSTRLRPSPALRELLNASGGVGVGLLAGPFLEDGGDPPPPPALAPQLLELLRPPLPPLAWTAGSPRRHLAALSPPRAPQRLLLLWTLPGTPLLSYGDELTPMPWDVIDKLEEGDNSSQARILELCRRLGSLRARERSLALGDAEPVAAGPSAAAFLRTWDQNERFLVVLNPGGDPLSHVTLQHPSLPPRATLRLSTHRPLPPDPHLDLGDLQLLPYEGLLLSFPPTQ